MLTPEDLEVLARPLHGRTTVETDGAHALAARLAARYWNLDDPARAAELTELLGADQVRIVIHPEQVRRYSF